VCELRYGPEKSYKAQGVGGVRNFTYMSVYICMYISVYVRDYIVEDNIFRDYIFGDCIQECATSTLGGTV